MSQQAAVWLLLLIGLVAANLPWIGERFFFVVAPKGGKRIWMRLLEWLVLYAVVGLVAVGMERKFYGEIHSQNWEFFVVTVCLFLVFSLPGFVYHAILKKMLIQRRRAS